MTKDNGNIINSAEYSKAWDEIPLDDEPNFDINNPRDGDYDDISEINRDLEPEIETEVELDAEKNIEEEPELKEEIKEPEVKNEVKEPETKEPEITNGIVLTNPDFVINGSKITVRSEEEIRALVERGLKANITLKKYDGKLEIIDFVEKYNLSVEDLVAIRDLKAGNSEAIQYFKKFTPEDEPEDNDYDDYDDWFEEKPKKKQPKKEYKPKIEGVKKERTSQDVYTELSESNPALAIKVLDAYNSMIPQAQVLFWNNPTYMQALIESVNIGEWEQVYPEALKIYNMSDITDFNIALQKATMIVAQSQNEQSQKTNDIPNEENANIEHIKNSEPDVDNKELSYDDAWNIPLGELEKQFY